MQDILCVTLEKRFDAQRSHSPQFENHCFILCFRRARTTYRDPPPKKKKIMIFKYFALKNLKTNSQDLLSQSIHFFLGQ